MAKGFSFEEVMRPLEPAKPVKGFSFAEVMQPVAEPEPAEVPTITSPEEIAPPQLAETRRPAPAVTPQAAPAAAPEVTAPAKQPATFLGELGKGAKGAVEYGLPSMGKQLQLQGSAGALVARQNQMALMDQIDQGQFKSLTDLKNDPRYQAMRQEGLDVGTVNAYFANRSLPQVNAKLRGKTAEEMVKLAGDTAGHIQTLNQYARENKAKYGPRVEKFTDINWTDPRVVADFTDWLGYNMGAGAVQMAPIMLAAVVTKQPGLLAVSGGMGVSEAVGNRLKFIQDKVKDLPPNKQGEEIAKYIAETGDVNLITGLASGSFDLLLGPAAKAAKGFLPKEVGKVAAVKTAAKELPKDVASEAVTGALQQTVQIAAAKKLQEEGRAVTPENILDVINSAAAEAAGAPVGTAVNVGMAALQAPADPASQLARAIEEDAQRAAATPSALRMRSALEEAQAPSQARGFTFEEVTAPPAAPVVPPAAPRVEPAVEPPEEPAVAPAEAISAPAPTPAIEVIPGMPTGEELAAPPQETVTPVTVSEAPVQPTQAAAALPDTPVVPPVTKPKAFEPTAPQHATQGLPIQEVPLSDLRLSKDVPQFKIGASEKGVVEPLGGKFERTGIAPIQVWRRLDGSLEIISGRHRFDLAQRSGEKTIPAQIHDESKGFDKVQAAILDAELNIRDGQGKVKDYVNYFKESGIDREAADAKGLLARATGKRSFTIANQGSDELVAAVRADQIGDEAAYYVALNAPNDARLQGVGIKAIMDGKSMNTAVNTMQAVKALAGENDTTTDMFGFDDSAMREAEEMAKLAAQKQREIQTRLSAISGAAKNPAVAKAEGIDIRDPEAVKRRIDELRRLKSAWDNWSTSPELIAEIRQARGVAAPALTPVLQTQTPEELRQKAEREAAATRREEEEKRKAEQKAKADEEREEFVLTGSDRPADEAAARGQADIFAAPPAEEAVVDKYVSKLDEQKKTESYETTDDVLVKTETSEWQGTISRKEFDDLVAAASASPQQRGNKYAINVVDTKDASAILTFTARGLTPTQQRVEVSMQLQRSQVMEGAVEPGVAVDENDPGFLGASDKEVKDVAKAFGQYADAQEDEQNTRVFDAPAKSDIVRIEEKARREGVLTIAEAKKRIAEWKKNARAQGETGANSDKVVLSLFDATGEWSKPWEEAGYQVFRFDIQTDPEMGDVNKFSASFFNDLFGAFDGQDIYAVLAACPCTDFAASGARHFAAKDESGKTVESVQLVKQTLATIEYFKPSVWAIENPVGRIEKLTGLPPWRLSFNPNHFGDPYTKKTLLWGRFNADLPVAPVVPTEGSKMHRMYGGKSQETKNARSVTPEGFAYAFFQANNAVDNPVMAVANKYDMLDRKVVEQAVKAGLTDKEIAAVVDEPYYMDLDYKAANDALRAATEAKQKKPAAPAPEPKQLFGIGPKGELVPKPPAAPAAPTEPALTPQQIQNAQDNADAFGGEVVWQEGDYALIRGYAKLTGDPVYIASKGAGYARVDIEQFTGDVIPSDVRQKMIEVKQKAEADAAKKHETDPFVKFVDGVAVSENIAPEVEGVIREWKKLLKLDVPLYVGTVEDAKANRNKYTGPHRRIGSGTLDANDRGSARRMTDGSYYILFKSTTSPTLMLETLAHEMGHVHEKLVYDKASQEDKDALREAHAKWLEKQKGRTAQELVNALRGRATQRRVKAPEGMTADELTSYWKSFGEWYADQTSRWAVSSKVPVTAVEKFFKRLGNQLRRFYQQLTNAKYLPDTTFAQYMERVTEKPVDIAPPDVVELKTTVDDKSSGIGAAVMGQRMINAADRFRKAAMTQHKLTKEQADAAMGRLIKDKVLNLDPVTGQFELRDGRFWNRDVLLRAAGQPDEDAATKMSEDLQPSKKLPPGRSPELAAAAQRLQRGEITAADFDELVNRYKPIPVYFSPLRPATPQEVYNALDIAKRQKIDPKIPSGYPVGLRLDIPAFNRHGVFVVSIHEKRTPSAPGKVIGYSSVAAIKDVTFGVGNQKEALKIAAGAAKDAIQTMEGKYVPITTEQAYQTADDAILSDDWVQIGFDPTRHAYFFDRSTTEPVVAANEVIQIGNMILAKGVQYAPKSSFLYNIDQGDLFGDKEAAPWQGEQTGPTVKRGRSPELTEAAERLRRGEITKAEYEEAVQKLSPVSVYAEPPTPPTDKQVTDALDANKRQYANVDVPTGTRVGLRLDIPAYERRNTWVVAIHQPKPTLTSPKASAILSYRSVAGLRNVTFGLGDQARSLRIAAGEFKDKLQTMEGEYVDMTPQEAYARAQELINDPNYIQIGFNPLRHSYFYDRSTMQPVVSADEVLQIGNFILAKGVTYGRKEDFLYSAPDGDAAIREAIEKEKAEEIRAKQIQEYTELRAKIARITAKVAKGEVSLEMQQNLARAMQASRELQVAIRTSVPRADTAEDFLHKALTEYKAKNISYDVLEVIQDIYNKRPELLSGLVLRVRKGKGRAAGAFDPFERMVFLYKGTSGIENPSTIRHEITHSLEQMMSDKQRIAVVQAWGKALQRAIKQNPDEVNQKYFQAVLDFVDNPSELTFATAISLMPSNDMYQYINPSEFWAVNAEKLLASELGSAWDKFKRFAKGMLEGLKNIFGFDNRYAIHKTFSQVMSGSKERLNKSSLAQFVQSTGGDFTLLRSIEDEKDLLEKYNRPKTPMLDQSPIRTFLTRQFKNGKEFFESAVKNPREAMVGAGNFVMDGLIYLRNKNVWYGSGLEARDFARYNGQLRTSEGIVTASVALDNAIRSGNIGVEVIFRGGIKYNAGSGTFVATKTEKGMFGVYQAQTALMRRLGDQLGTDIIQGYLEAKRSISIMNELYDREAAFEAAKEQLRVLRESGADPDDIAIAKELEDTLAKEVDSIRKAASSVNMSQPEMDEFSALDEKHPELRDIMDNWTAINQNMLRFWRQVGLLSQGRYERLAAIKDYVPWYRIMSDELDLHDSDQSAVQSTTRSMTNIGREKLFKRGKPTSVVDFRAKAGQRDFKIQPSSVVQVEVNGKKVSPDLVTATPDGNVRIDMPLEENDLVVFKTNREIQNIIDNMTRNVMRMTMNGIRQYAANRIVLEYASRNADNKVMVFPKVDKDKGRFNWIVNGKTVVVEIQDPLVASSIYGMENLNLQMWRPLAAVANLTRRSITLSGAFQVKQVFKDAPTAALVTGVKNPAALIGGAWKGFLTSLTNTDPVVDILKAAGIGGYLSPARTPEADIKRRLGIMNRNVFSAIIKGLDHIGDSSDMAQRVAAYKRVMAETGDEAQAQFQAANVINFLHHGSAGYMQAVVKTVPFLGAYMNASDVLIRALVGGGLKGMSRKKALARLAVTTSFLVSLTILYAMLAGGDPEYDELDDQTKLRNIIIPGTKIMLPMNTSAAFFYKAIPELIYNEVTRRGTENEMDRRRVRAALADAARDMLLGPEPAPAGIKQLFEVAINHDFFTGRPVIPEGLKDVDAAEQYTGRTSELGKKISEMLAIPGTDGKRVLSPIEADHIVRGVFGSAGAMAQWVSNSIGAIAEQRPEPTPRETPITGGFLREEVPRGREDLFYDLKDAVGKKYNTWSKLIQREAYDEATAYLQKHGDVAMMQEYVNEVEEELKEINAEIRRLEETKSTTMSPKERREQIDNYKRLKQEAVLASVKMIRRLTFNRDEEEEK